MAITVKEKLEKMQELKSGHKLMCQIVNLIAAVNEVSGTQVKGVKDSLLLLKEIFTENHELRLIDALSSYINEESALKLIPMKTAPATYDHSRRGITYGPSKFYLSNQGFSIKDCHGKEIRTTLNTFYCNNACCVVDEFGRCREGFNSKRMPEEYRKASILWVPIGEHAKTFFRGEIKVTDGITRAKLYIPTGEYELRRVGFQYMVLLSGATIGQSLGIDIDDMGFCDRLPNHDLSGKLYTPLPTELEVPITNEASVTWKGGITERDDDVGITRKFVKIQLRKPKALIKEEDFLPKELQRV